jgi:hypothetical protein
MAFLKLIMAFAPWICFLLIAQGSLFRLKLGLAVALILSVVMGLAGVHRGVILWVGLIFFAYSTAAVVGLNNMWTAQHMGVLANAVLAASVWLTVVMGKPFTLAYAREHVDSALWDNPAFMKSNLIVTSVWGLAFTVNTALAWGKMERFILPEWGYETVSYAFLLAAAGFSTWYPAWIRRRRAAGSVRP